MRVSETNIELPHRSLWQDGRLAVLGIVVLIVATGLFLWDQARSLPAESQGQIAVMSGSVGILSPASAPGKNDYSLILFEGTQAATKHRFAVSKYMYDALNSTVASNGVPQLNQVKAYYNRQTAALYYLTFITPQHDPIYNTEQNVFGNIPGVIGGWIAGALLVIFGIFTTFRTYLDRIAAPLTIIATVTNTTAEPGCVAMRLTPLNDLYHKGKPFTVRVSPAQYNPVSFAKTVEVSLSPAGHHVYGIRPHSTYVE